MHSAHTETHIHLRIPRNRIFPIESAGYTVKEEIWEFNFVAFL